MKVYKYSEARKKFASLFIEALRDGKIQIEGKDGTLFALVPNAAGGSPLDVPSLNVNCSRDEILATLRETRERK